MNLIKKLLLIVILVLFTYVLWRLLRKRVELQREIAKEGFSIPFFGSASENELSNLKNTNTVLIQNSHNNELPLKEYCIKSSYNTALTGNYINLDMISYVLSRGCRFIDLEIFYIGQTTIDIKNLSTTKYTAQVAYSTDNTFTTINTENSILLDQVLTTIVTNAFSSPSPNLNDPLFINLRVKSNNYDVYKAIAASIDNTIKEKLYTDKSNVAIPVKNSTKLSEIMGKIVICIDKTIDRSYKSHTSCNDIKGKCYDLTKFINMETGSEDLNLLRYSEVMDQCTIPIEIKNDNKSTTVKTMKYVIPNTKNDNSYNPNINDFIIKYSAQIPAYRFYKNDKQLRIYEDFFDENGTAFVPLAKAITYFKDLNN